MSEFQSKSVKDKGRGHKVNKKGGTPLQARPQDTNLFETLSKPTVLLEEKRKVVEIITKITFIKNERDFMRANPSTEREGKSVKK